MARTSREIVIVGGGAGGLELAVRLAGAGHDNVRLIDSGETHVWKPRLHELAAGLRRGHVDELGFADLARQWGFVFERGTLCHVEPDRHRITVAAVPGDQGDTLVPQRKIGYGVLVLALGGVTPDLGVEGVGEHALLLDREADAEALSRRFSARLLAHAVVDERAPVNVVIVGTGATGIELGAHLATDARSTALAPPGRTPPVQITLLEAADTFMPGMAAGVREAIRARLCKASVEIAVGRQVSRVYSDAVETDDGERFEADLTVWATGRVGPPLAGDITALATNDKRQWRVRSSLQTNAYDDVFAIGDCAYVEDNPAPPTAQAASEQAAHLARELPRYLAGGRPADFEYQDKGTLLSLGQAGSVGRIRGALGSDVQIGGRLAHAAYRGLQRRHHLILLGPVKGSVRIIGSLLQSEAGPGLKVH